ncbi:MAG: ERF family protein [Mailhella sp.]|nr:ERF family protein [Mailhella sp.]
MLITHSEQITDLAKALLSVQTNLQPAVQDSTNPFIGNKYASLNAVMESCRSVLAANGIVLTQAPVPAEPGFCALETMLVHAESGQFIASTAMAPLPKADPQGVGTALTYLRRYALSAMLGIVTEPDTDGEFDAAPFKAKASATAAPQRRQPQAKHPSNDSPFTSPAAGPKSQAPKERLGTPLSPAFAGLPELPGITYRDVLDESGDRLILASGDTMENRSSLKKAGFQWNPTDRRWWKKAA